MVGIASNENGRFWHDVNVLIMNASNDPFGLENVKTGSFPGENGGFAHPKIRRGFSPARFGSSMMFKIDPARVDFRVFGPQKRAFEVDFRLF